MKEELKLALVQHDPVWEDKAANLEMIREMIMNHPDRSDLIILPEMFSTGFTMNVEEMAEPHNGDTLQWMKGIAVARKAAVCGSFIVEEDGHYYNRFTFMDPSGGFAHYDKRHLFTLGNEEQYFSPGQELVEVEYEGWTISLQICYDLRFPVWCRNSPAAPFDLQIFVASWPERRIGAWDTLLQARAIENQAYVAAANRIGEDGNGFKHVGHSQVVDPMGEVVAKTESEATILTASLSAEKLQAFREKLPFLGDMDEFGIQL